MSAERFRKLQITILMQYEDAPIEGVYLAAKQSLRDLNGKLQQREKIIESDSSLSEDEKYSFIDHLSDDYYQGGLIVNLAEELVIVALYKTVEIAIKKMADRSGLFTAQELHNFFRVNSLRSSFRRHVADLRTLPGFDSYDELRCINNSVKHSGKASSELANYGWVQGDELENLWPDYIRLKPGVRQFVEELASKIIDKVT